MDVRIWPHIYIGQATQKIEKQMLDFTSVRNIISQCLCRQCEVGNPPLWGVQSLGQRPWDCQVPATYRPIPTTCQDPQVWHFSVQLQPAREGKGRKEEKNLRTVMQTFFTHFAVWQFNHHLLHFQIFITKNMSGRGNAKPLGCEMGPSSMLDSTSWQVFDQFTIFPDFHIPSREVKIFHFSLTLEQTNLNTELLKHYLMFFLMTCWAIISQSCIMWQLLQLVYFNTTEGKNM